LKAVLFALNTSYVQTNLAVRCLKKYIDTVKGKEEDVSVEIIERNLKDKTDEIIHALYDQHADVYGFSCYIFNIKEMLRFASDIKKLLPKSRIVFGGPEASYDCEDILSRYAFVDNIIAGEGEKAFYDLLKGHTAERIIHAGKYTDFLLQGNMYDNETGFKGNIVYYESSRGCPYNCSYCLSSAVKGVRAKSTEKTLSDLLSFENMNNDISIVKFVDRTFNFDKERTKSILNGLLDSKYTKCYHMEIMAELLDDEIFDILKRFPKGKIQFEAGIQSTNPETLQAVNRNGRTEKALSNIRKVKDMGNIKIHCDLIAGLPFENMESFRRSFDMTYDVSNELQLGFLKLLKGSKIREETEKYGYIAEDEPPYEVLANNHISFDDMFRLKRMAALIERYKNGKGFTDSMDMLISYFLSPFDFYYDLDKHIGRHVSELSQHEAYKCLFMFTEKNNRVGRN
jgi:radical SAM superfamily enzyme YgiQ (UPF0313 family)